MCISRNGKRRICPNCPVAKPPACKSPLLHIGVNDEESDTTLKTSHRRYHCQNIPRGEEAFARCDLQAHETIPHKDAAALQTLSPNLDFACLNLVEDELHVRGQRHLRYNAGSLTILDLNSYHICDEGAAELGNALRFNHVVKELRLMNNGITAKGVFALCERLKQNENIGIERLSVSSNPIGDNGVEAIADYIQCQHRRQGGLKALCLTLVALGDQGALALAKALQHNPIEELYLQDNHLGPQGAAHLAALVSADTILKVLNLHNNLIGNDGVVTLIDKGLILNPASCLKQFILSSNNLGNEAAVVIGAYLGWNPTLEILDLSMNQIGDAGLHFMAVALTQNFRLSHLNLCKNDVTDSGVTVLAMCLKANSKLTSLWLNGNESITEIGVRALAFCRVCSGTGVDSDILKLHAFGMLRLFVPMKPQA